MGVGASLLYSFVPGVDVEPAIAGEAEERGDAKPKAKAPAMADEIPF
jgi:hypothetical protein